MTDVKRIIDFGTPGEVHRWEIVNDAVMGGLSDGAIMVTPEGAALFQGEVSLENYGGFTSMRTLPEDFDLSGHEGLSVRVRGDGKRYRLRLRTDTTYEGVAYQAWFATEPGEWVTISLQFKDFIPVFRGNIVDDAPPLDVGRITRIGFMIADKQKGPFRLEIQWVKAV